MTMIKKLSFPAILMLLLTATATKAQDKRTFQGTLTNKELGVFLVINFYDNDITIPGQEVFGQMPGYFGADKDLRRWPVVSAQIAKDGKSANLVMTNDYGSEDLTATLFLNPDSTYTLRQDEGSTLKIAVERKWVKMPKRLDLKRTK